MRDSVSGVTEQEVDIMLSRLHDPRKFNKPVLTVNIEEQMKGRNAGYPKHMYHKTMEPRLVLDDSQFTELQKLGYSERYIHRDHPKMLYRRNLSDKFKDAGFLENVTAKSPEEEEQIRASAVPRLCSDWVDHPDQLEPMPDGEAVDLSTENARLKAELARLEAVQNQAPASPPDHDPEGEGYELAVIGGERVRVPKKGRRGL